jgi:DnaJ family protein C protein 2
MPTFTKTADATLDWPTDADGVPTISIECAGPGFLEFHQRRSAADPEKLWRELLAADRAGNDGTEEDDDDDDDDDDKSDDVDDDASMPSVDLFSLKEHELESIDYYKVLHLSQRPNMTADDVKKAYRKACLKYHPDKTGRGEEDAVFLKVKAAFETLSTQRQAYDSTEMPFDDGLPSEDPDDFFAEYGPVFERNLHFDSRLLGAKSNHGNKKRTKKTAKFAAAHHKPPSLGDTSTSIDKVHEFYDYWTHFESWRDFSLQAARELETEDHLENAESRYEKRWYQKEIDRHAKKLKQQEVARITTLVERAMAADPRLIQERKRLIEEKEQRQREREQQALEKKMAAEEAAKAEERRIEEEKKQKAEEKLQREKEKKMLRKAKQSFRRQVSGALEELLEKEHALEDEVDLICSQLDRTQLIELNDALDAKSAAETVKAVKKHADELRGSATEEKDTANTAKNGSSAKSKMNNENGLAKDTESASKAKAPFTKEELSALAKGIKKFPPGGANRWDQIANYINNSCRPDDPKTKEECIETFNQINKSAKPQRNGGPNVALASDQPKPAVAGASAAPASNDDGNGWTAEQDQQLQDGLAQFPATMDKNERWTNIAQGVPGKSKKECVQRFKDIRNALKAKK